METTTYTPGGCPPGVYDVGDMPVIVFAFRPVPQHPTAEADAITVTVYRPDGTTFGTWTTPSATMTKTTADDDGTTVTTWTFEMPEPFDQGSRRKPWTVRCQSTSGIIAAVESQVWVTVPGVG